MTSWLIVIPSADTYQEMGIKKGPPKVMHLILCVIDLLFTVHRPRSDRFGPVLAPFWSSDSLVSWNLSTGNDIRI